MQKNAEDPETPQEPTNPETQHTIQGFRGSGVQRPKTQRPSDLDIEEPGNRKSQKPPRVQEPQNLKFSARRPWNQ